MRQLQGFLVLAGAAALVACATTAPAPPPPAPVAAHTVVADPAAVAAQPTLFKAPFGYEKIVVSDGTVRYCRNDMDTDSRVKRTRVCMTEDQLKASQANSQNFMDDVQRHGVGATSTGTPNNMPGH